LSCPDTGWMPGDIEVQDTPAIMGNDEEAIQKAKGDRSALRRNPPRQSLRGGYAERFASVAPRRCLWVHVSSNVKRFVPKHRNPPSKAHHEPGERPNRYPIRGVKFLTLRISFTRD